MFPCARTIEEAGRRLRRRILAYSLAICAGIAIIVTVVAVELRQAALDHSRAGAANLSAAFEEQVRRVLNGVETAMELFKRRIEAADGGDLDLSEAARLKPELAASTIQVAAIDASGRLRATTLEKNPERIDLSSREYFKVHRDNAKAGLYIGKPEIGLVSKQPAIQVTRRLEKPDGSFAGVLVFSLDPEWLTASFRNVDLGSKNEITLAGTDAIICACHSGSGNRPVPVGASLAGAKSLADAATADRGSYIGRSAIDGATRVFDWRKIPGYPLLLIVGFGEDEVMATAKRLAFIVLGLGGAAILLTGAMAAMVMREISQRVRHEIALQEESQKLSLANRGLELQHAALLTASTELAAERINLQKTNAGLLLAQQRSEAANRAKTAFLANMSHELRTPLNAIIGFSEIIRDKMFGPDSPAYFDYAGDIHNAGVHLLEIINNVLDVAKVESGKVELSEAVRGLTPILEASLRSIKVQAKNGRLRILRQYPKEEIYVRCDETRLKQAVINILSNAVKFTPEGGRIEVRQEIEASGDVCIAVKDTGIGMTEAEIVAAFEQFRQIDNSFNKRFQGTGLGLPLAKQLVELHGGTIAVSSKPSVGTEICIRLPAHRVAAAHAESGEMAALRATPATIISVPTSTAGGLLQTNAAFCQSFRC